MAGPSQQHGVPLPLLLQRVLGLQGESAVTHCIKRHPQPLISGQQLLYVLLNRDRARDSFETVKLCMKD